MKNIVLIGMMGSGKSTVGDSLSRMLGLEWVDTDDLIEAKEGRSIRDIFAREGEDYFRNLEQAVSGELAGRQGLVISCGGGLPLRRECIAPLKDAGLVFWLYRDPGKTYDTLDAVGRPLAQQGREAFLERFAQREPIYQREADYIIRGHTTTQQAAERIAAIYREVCQP